MGILRGRVLNAEFAYNEYARAEEDERNKILAERDARRQRTLKFELRELFREADAKIATLRLYYDEQVESEKYYFERCCALKAAGAWEDVLADAHRVDAAFSMMPDDPSSGLMAMRFVLYQPDFFFDAKRYEEAHRAHAFINEALMEQSTCMLRHPLRSGRCSWCRFDESL